MKKKTSNNQKKKKKSKLITISTSVQQNVGRSSGRLI